SLRIFEVARNNADRASADQRRHYNLRRREWKPPVGSLVLVRRHALSNATEGFAAKLAFRVAKFPSSNIVQLHLPGSRRRRTASLNQLKPYHGEDMDTEEDENEEADPTGGNDSTLGGRNKTVAPSD
ncbi:hypothetical protein KR032_008229, partial [Drosophila birchii]